jgi:hypothetical protein
MRADRYFDLEPEFDARCAPRPCMLEVFGGPYEEPDQSPWEADGYIQRADPAIKPSHPGPPVNNYVRLKHKLTGAVLQVVGLGAAREYAKVRPRRAPWGTADAQPD